MPGSVRGMLRGKRDSKTVQLKPIILLMNYVLALTVPVAWKNRERLSDPIVAKLQFIAIFAIDLAIEFIPRCLPEANKLSSLAVFDQKCASLPPIRMAEWPDVHSDAL